MSKTVIEDDINFDGLIKNPERKLSEEKVKLPYEPEYKRLGREPSVIHPENDFYSSMDGETIDETGDKILTDDPNGHIIDNNDYVNIDFTSNPAPPNHRKFEVMSGHPDDGVNSSRVEPNKTKQSSALIPEVGQYILMVFGKLISSGSLEEIQARVQAIVYGDDETFTNIRVETTDIVVLKRVSVSVGVFVGE